MNGLARTSGNNWATGLLMMYDMGVSAQSITKLQNIQSAVKSLDLQSGEGLSGDEVLMEKEEVQYKPEYIERITDDLGMVTDEHIEKLIEEGKEIHISELRESIHKKASEVLEEHKLDVLDRTEDGERSANQDLGEPSQSMLDQIQEIKSQIHQIRTKLTAEAAQKISRQMPVESSYLSEVANALQQMEQEEMVQALKVVEVPVTEENIQLMSQTMGVVQDISHYFDQTIQIELETEGQASLSDIQSTLNAYRANETPVEKRFGENITKVEDQIKALLESQNIEISPETIQAAKALITNQMEVDPIHITQLQEIVVRLNTFLDEMTPIQVATCIKEGMNPYRSSIDELLSWMGDHKIKGLKNTVAETIIALEKSGQINEHQKQGMIGIYRILQGVTKQKEEIIGYLYRNNLPLTLENLQRAVAYGAGKKRIEVKIDDTFGELESLTYDKQGAKTLIEESVETSNKMLERLKVLENMELPITEQGTRTMDKMSTWLYPYLKEQFKKSLQEFQEISTLPDSFLEKLEQIKNVDPHLVQYMNEQKIPLTLSHIYWMDQLVKDPGLYGHLLAQQELLNEEVPDRMEELEEMLEKIELKAREYKEEATLVGDLKRYKEYKQIEEVVQFQKERMTKEGMYQIPFIVDGERKWINLYLHEEKGKVAEEEKSHLKAILTYQTKHLGEIKAYIELKGEVIGYRVESETEKEAEQLEEYREILLEKLKHIGYDVQYSEFVSDVLEHKNEAVSVTKYGESFFERII